MTLGPHYGSLKSCTLLIFVFFHLHGRRAKIRGTPLFFTRAESFDISVLEVCLHEELSSHVLGSKAPRPGLWSLTQSGLGPQISGPTIYIYIYIY